MCTCIESGNEIDVTVHRDIGIDTDGGWSGTHFKLVATTANAEINIVEKAAGQHRNGHVYIYVCKQRQNGTDMPIYI